MRRQQKRALPLLIGAMVAALAACSNSAGTGGATSPAGDASPAATTSAGTTPAPSATVDLNALGIGKPTAALCDGRKPVTVGVDLFSDTQDYVVNMRKSMEDVNKQMGGCITFSYLTDNLDPATAVANIKTFVAKKVDAVLLFQVVASAQPGIMQLLDQAKIPVIAHAVPAPGAPFISPSDADAAKAAADGLVAAVQQKFPGQTPWIVLANEPSVGDVSTNRVNHQADIIKQTFPDIPGDHLILLDTNGTPDDSFTRAKNIAAKLPTDAPILLAGINDDAVGGAFRALDQVGLSKNVIAAGMSALYPSGIQNICTYSQFVGTVDFLPDRLGDWLDPALLAITDGVKLPDTISPPVALLTKADVPARFPGFKC